MSHLDTDKGRHPDGPIGRTTLNNPATLPALNTVESLNRACFCRTLNEDRLRENLESDPSLAGIAQDIAETRPHLF